jgi:hypothetical protein
VSALSFVTLAAYDYSYLLRSLPTYYAIADEIIIGVDRDRISWAKQPFAFDDQAFIAAIAALDVERKVRVVEHDFHLHDHPLHNETYERNVLSSVCREGNWIVQIDSDEYMINPAEFKAFMDRYDRDDVCLHANWITVFKSFGRQHLIIDAHQPFDATAPFAVRQRMVYTTARNVDMVGVLSPAVLVHFAWGRTRQELHQKLTNWGHAREFDAERYLAFWDSVTLENYHTIRDFHPLGCSNWKALRLIHTDAAVHAA